MPKIIGIDLGTTNSCVSILDGKKPVVIPNVEGSRITPSVVAFTDKGEQLVGNLAKRQANLNPERTINSIKRLIGRKFDDPELASTKSLVGYKIIPDQNQDACVEIEGKFYNPSQISAMILTKMKEIAEEFLGETVRDAVITVPAYFNDAQRQSTKDAGLVAGLNVERIINEPTSAAIAYNLAKKTNGLVAIFDLGGGTFDISILEIREGVIEVKSTNGNTFLGGDDFDGRLVNYLKALFQQKFGIDLSENKMALQRIKEAVEACKHELSVSEEATINLPFLAVDKKGPKHLTEKITRKQFEEMVLDLVKKLEEPCKIALKDAGCAINDLAEIVLVGGMTRVPIVRRKVVEIFGKSPLVKINPDEVVAVGAAIQGNILKGTFDDLLLIDITPLSLGVETQGGIFTRLIEKNTPIPIKKSEIFSTTRDNQEMVEIHVLQGEREMAAGNKSLGKFRLTGIPKAPRGQPKIEVSFEIDTNGIVHVSARDKDTRKEHKIQVSGLTGLTKEELERITEEAKKHKESDVSRKGLQEAKNLLETNLYVIEKFEGEFVNQLSEKDKKEIDALIDRSRKLMNDGTDVEAIVKTSEEIEKVVTKMTEIVYDTLSRA